MEHGIVRDCKKLEILSTKKNWESTAAFLKIFSL